MMLFVDRTLRLMMVALLALLVASNVGAQTPPPGTVNSPADMMCPNASVWGSGIVTNICWSCLLPIRIMGIMQLGDGEAPPNASDENICFCDGDAGVPSIGTVLGMWAPTALIELVRQPYCSPSLGGTRIRESFRLAGMKDGSDGGSSSNQFLNFHWFSFPLYQIIRLLLAPECNAGGFTNFDLLYPSELDPTWVEAELAPFTQPEVVVASNPLLQATCPVDCAAANFSAPVERMWWCAGCWGSMYPFTGNVPSGGSPPRVSSLLATRALASLHRRGLAWRTVGDDVVCGGEIAPMIPKQQYKMSMLYPLPEADPGIRTPRPGTSAGTGVPQIDNYQWTQKCCHNIGTSTFLWGEWRNIPATGEDFVYLLWRWTDCCVR
jgi:conjugal transfer pilus assembly protein TraU